MLRNLLDVDKALSRGEAEADVEQDLHSVARGDLIAMVLEGADILRQWRRVQNRSIDVLAKREPEPEPIGATLDEGDIGCLLRDAAVDGLNVQRWLMAWITTDEQVQMLADLHAHDGSSGKWTKA